MELEAKHVLSIIHSSMNTFSKINRLPPEILALIPSFLTSYKDLVHMTHVCRFWRNTITSSSSLWSSLDIHQMHWDLAVTYMDRCGNAPLDVTFCSHPNKNGPFLEKVLPHSSRIRKIKVPYISWCHIVEILDGFDAPLPLLREVILDASSETEPPTFRQPLLAGAPNLVSLALCDYWMLPGTLHNFVIPTLTHFSLSFRESDTTFVDEILELLRRLPLIEDLDIRADVRHPHEETPVPDQLQSVDLPHLRNLHIRWSKRRRAQYVLLTHIQYPPDCSVLMRVRSLTVTERQHNAFPESWDDFHLPGLSCVTLRMKREQGLTECAVIVKKPNGASVTISQLCRIEHKEPCRNQDDNRIFSAAITLIQRLPLRWILKFVLEEFRANEMLKLESFEIPPALVKLIRSDMPNLTTLSLTRTCVSELFNMLTPPSPPPTSIPDLFDSNITPEPDTPCPTLKVLEMRHPAWIAPQNCREAVALAKARKYGGVPFEKVFFCSPDVPESMALDMSLYVDEIDIRSCSGCE